MGNCRSLRVEVLHTATQLATTFYNKQASDTGEQPRDSNRGESNQHEHCTVANRSK
jgi:hypothetical protein